MLTALDRDDAVVSTYREHGHALAQGRADGLGHGRDVRQGRPGAAAAAAARCTSSTSRTGSTAATPSSAAGSRWPSAWRSPTGCAARAAVTACFFGDGAYAEGEFHESANLAALWRLPLLFCCENNLYAMGTAIEREQAETDLALRAASYGMAPWSVDGMDVLAVEDATRHAADRIRAGGGPCFLELRTYRFRAHSMYDPELLPRQGGGRAMAGA